MPVEFTFLGLTWLEKSANSSSLTDSERRVDDGANARLLSRREGGEKARTDEADRRRASISFMACIRCTVLYGIVGGQRSVTTSDRSTNVNIYYVC